MGGSARTRRFFEELARTHRVVRYDRIGAGLSDRELDEPADDRVGGAGARGGVRGAAGASPGSCSRARARARRPCASRARRPSSCARSCSSRGTSRAKDVPDATRSSLVEFTRLNWRLAAQMFSGLLIPHGSGEEIDGVSPPAAARRGGDAAAAFLELELTADARPFLPKRDDAGARRSIAAATAPCRSATAASSPRCSRTPASSRSSGDSHLPWMDDQRELQRALAGVPRRRGAASRRTATRRSARRETEVLRLVAAGLSNREIASSLVLSEHTVHRHVANILRKLTQSSRAAAAAQATRAGYI